ncbi:hypothetical protein TR13x_10270 [Caloranaerobacter sp. TR13]|uniref:hypothetical protein n=1 Tax=Caloranaerobacter sp. TR13 TaxID=1302151 RepID=UPI0006D43CE7|nr:hypothetical protein [Caloranaerobacter sp. TR13]KPU26394.1 hypothetical protein TR13x_10270 [Caloranaerobacter sp. TR13]
MKIKLFAIIMSLFLISGCTINNDKKANNIQDNDKNLLTIEEIKKEYDASDWKIVNLTKIKRNNTDYILVESQIPTLANRFEFINLKSGDRDILPTNAYFIESYKVINENYIVLLANGKHSESTLRTVPFEIHCIRSTENINCNYDFIAEYKDIDFPINKRVFLGSKVNEVIAEIETTLNGIQIVFEPQEGFESIFYADFLDVPPTEIDYNKETNQLIICFKNTKINSKLYKQKLENLKGNYYFNSIEFHEKFNNSYIKINLKEPSKFFNVKTFNLYDSKYPCIEIRFKSNKEVH